MALKKKQTERVRIKSIATGTVVGVSKETADMMLRNKGEYELVKGTDKAPAKTAAKTAPKPPAKTAPKTAEKAPAKTADESTPATGE